MTSVLDIYRAAKVLVEQYGGDDAVLMAAKRADELLELGDIDGQLYGRVSCTLCKNSPGQSTMPVSR